MIKFYMKIKSLGQIFTPGYIVDFMLTEIGYSDSNIPGSTIMEPAAGDGNFIVQILRRAFNQIKKDGAISTKETKNLLKNIFAIEIDSNQYELLLRNSVSEIYKHIDEKILDSDTLEKILRKQFICEDTLRHNPNKKFDFIVGNPPYIRLHNLDKSNLSFLRKEYSSMEIGSVDIYYAFYEWSLNNLTSDGLLCFISPNSFMNNSSAKGLRNLLNGKIDTIYNFQSSIIFENASTYNSIVIAKDKAEKPLAFLPIINNSKIRKGTKKDIFYLGDKIILSKNNWIKDFINEKKPNLSFKNGLATLRDNLFISSEFMKLKNGNYLFNGYEIESDLIREIIKISTYFTKDIKRVCIFPYKINNNLVSPMSLADLKKYPLAFKYFSSHKKLLLERDIDKNALWFHFGRSQAIQSILFKKIILKTLIKDKVSFEFVPKGVLVYSGLYSNFDSIKKSKDFLDSKKVYNYFREVGFDKRGDYKFVTSNLLKEMWKN